MNLNRKHRKIALASAVISASTITSQAAVTATSVFNGTNSEITLSFTEGSYTVGDLKGFAFLSWVGTGQVGNYGSSTTIFTNALISSSPLTPAAVSYSISGGDGNFGIRFNEFNIGQTITGGSLLFTLPGNVPASTLPLAVGSFSGSNGNLTVIPEPGSIALLLLGGVGMVARRKR